MFKNITIFRWFQQVRCIFTVSSLILSIYMTLFIVHTVRGQVLNFVIWVDYAFWCIFFLVTFSTCLDLELFWRNYSYASTLTLNVVVMTLAFTGRIGSWLYSETVTSFNIVPIGGSIIDTRSLHLCLLLIPASVIASFTTILHTLFKKPIVLIEATDLYTIVNNIIDGFVKNLSKYWLSPLVSFVIGFTVRFYPEIKCWPLPIGWDTWEYMAMARDFTVKLNPFVSYIWLGGYRNLPPFLTITMGISTYLLSPIIIAKVYPSLTMGLLSMFTTLITSKIGLNPLASTAVGIIMAFNPYVIGQTHQWFRHILGVTMLLFYVYLSEGKTCDSWRTLTLIILALSYELTAVIVVLISIYEILIGKNKKLFTASLIVSTLLFLYYMRYPEEEVIVVTAEGISAKGLEMYNYHDLLMYTLTWLLILSPLISTIIVWKKFSKQYRFILTILILASIAPLVITPALGIRERWFTMLLTLLIPIACVGIYAVSKKTFVLFLLANILLGYMYVATDYGYVKLNLWKIDLGRGFPWRLTPVINIKDMQTYENISEIIKEMTNYVLLISLHGYPFIHYYIRNPTNILSVGWEDPNIITVAHYINISKRSIVFVVTSINLTQQKLEIINDGTIYKEYLPIIEKMEIKTIISNKINLYEIKLKD